MSAGSANNLNNNANSWMGNNNVGSQLPNITVQHEKPCPVVPPVVVSYVYGSPIGWNAVLVGLLSCVLALIFLLMCLYYLAFRRRRYSKEILDASNPVVLVDKEAVAAIPVTSTSQTVTTTFINEADKETKISTYSEQSTGPIVADEFVANGHAEPITNGLLANGNTDQSELHLLKHEHH